MAGSIFGLPLSQRVDSNGKPLAGWLVYLYLQNSSTPVNSYQDTALSVLNTWPVIADASGMMPQFWLADGSYRVRATSGDGSLTLFDIPSIQALGPSTGSAPSGSVDPTAIFQTGDVIWVDTNATRSGWVRDNGRTIGSATSGASERANADCQALFLYLWNNFADAICPVQGGRGGSALGDWTANAKITTPDKRGYIAGGLDDMGNSAASRWSSAPVILGTVTTGGGTVGENTHTLSTAQMPVHSHGITDPGHAHSYLRFAPAAGTTAGAGATAGNNTGDTTVSNTTGISINNAGSGSAHNVAQLTCLGTFFRKL
jgi:hypothetical protein